MGVALRIIVRCMGNAILHMTAQYGHNTKG